MDHSGKIMYLAGVWDGMIQLAVDAGSQPAAVQTYFGGDQFFDERATGLDRFFEQPENALVPIVQALRVVAMLFQGSSKADTDELAASERLAAAKCAVPAK